MPACKSYSTSVTVISERPRIANVMKLAINYNVISTIELISHKATSSPKSADCRWSICAISISSFGSPTPRRRCMPRSCSSVTSPAAAGL